MAKAILRMSYPTHLELCEFCIESQLISEFPTEYSAYESAIAAAIAKFESDTQWRPFVAPDADQTKAYKDWHWGFLDLKGGFASITSVTFDDEPDPAVEGEDYELKPNYSTPTRWLSLKRTPAQKVTIVGKPGYATTCPADVKRALLALGASKIANLLSPGQLTRITQGEITYQYAQGAADNPTTQTAQWLAEYEHTVAIYTRRSFA